MIKAYLLTWNSQRFPWPELAEETRRVAAGEKVTSRWGCGRNKHIQPGDRLFLLRQGAEPKRNIRFRNGRISTNQRATLVGNRAALCPKKRE